MDPRHLVRRSLSWAAATTLFLAPWLIVTPARADGGDASYVHACAGPKGQLRIVKPHDRCLPAETPVHWPMGSSGGAPEVVDSNGQHVGYPSLLGPQVAREVGDVWLLLPAGTTGFFPAAFPLPAASPVFESRDCQGTLYLQASHGFLQGVFTHGTKMVYPGGVIKERPLTSMRFFGNCFNFSFASSQLTGELTEFDPASLAGLVPPFHVK